MYFLIFILLLLLLVSRLFFIYEVNVRFSMDTDRDKMCLLFSWLPPFVRVKAELWEGGPLVSVYIGRRLVFRRSLRKKNACKKNPPDFSKWLSYLDALSIRDAFAWVGYGLDDPFATAIADGALQMIRAWFPGAAITQSPDFLPEGEYIRIRAGMEVNLGKTFLRLMQSRFPPLKLQRRFRYE